MLLENSISPLDIVLFQDVSPFSDFVKKDTFTNCGIVINSDICSYIHTSKKYLLVNTVNAITHPISCVYFGAQFLELSCVLDNTRKATLYKLKSNPYIEAKETYNSQVIKRIRSLLDSVYKHYYYIKRNLCELNRDSILYILFPSTRKMSDAEFFEFCRKKYPWLFVSDIIVVSYKKLIPLANLEFGAPIVLKRSEKCVVM
jgi:hypothetical protein